MPEAAPPVDLRVLVVDDEPIARRALVRLLGGHPDVVVVGACADGQVAVEAIAALAPDLVLLDVQMAGLDGFGVIAAVGAARMPAVVFITAYDEHAVRAFEVHAVDYLVKPFSDARFHAAIARARQQLRARQAVELADRLAGLLSTTRTAAPPPAEPAEARLVIASGGRTVVVPVADIDWIEAQDYYALLHVGAHSHLMRESIRSLETRLDPARFVRVHRSALVNVARVREVKRTARGESLAFLTDGTTVRISRSRREQVVRLVRAAAAR